MPNRDIRNKLVPTIIMNSAIASDTNTDSAELNVADYDGGVKFDILASIYVDGDYAVQIHVSDESGFTPGASTLLSGDNLIPTGASVSLGAASALSSVLNSIGFIAAKKYCKVRIVSTNFAASGATIIVIANSNPEIEPGV